MAKSAKAVPKDSWEGSSLSQADLSSKKAMGISENGNVKSWNWSNQTWDVHQQIAIFAVYFTLRLFSIAMENGPFIDGLPIKITSIIIAGFIMSGGTLLEHCSFHMLFGPLSHPFAPNLNYIQIVFLFLSWQEPRKHSATIHMNHMNVPFPTFRGASSR